MFSLDQGRLSVPAGAPDGPHPAGSLTKPFVARAWARAHPGAPPPIVRCDASSRCWSRSGHGTLGLVQATALSCNTYFRALAADTPTELLVTTLLAAGFLPPDPLTPEAAIGLPTDTGRVVAEPQAILRAYVTLLREPWDPSETVRREVLAGLRDSAREGTAAGLAELGFYAKTGTAPAIDGRPLATSGWAVAVDETGRAQELHELYAAFCAGRPSPLKPLAIQYADYSAWQRERLKPEVLQAQLGYWKSELQGALTTLALPPDKPRPATPSLRGATEAFQLPKSLLDKLQALGREEQATLFMVMEAAFAALLRRQTGQDDLLVGTPFSGRSDSDTQQLIGCFLNTLVLRSQFEEGTSFRTLLRQVRQRALEAYAHADVPFEQLVAEVPHERDPGRSALFQVMFVLHSAGQVSQVPKLSWGGDLVAETFEVRADALRRGAAERPRGAAGVQHRPLRGRHDSPPLPGVRRAAGGGDARAGEGALGAADSGGRAGAAEAVQPDGARVPEGQLHRAAVRAAGGEEPGRGGGENGGRVHHLRRAGGPGQPAGAGAAAAGHSAGLHRRAEPDALHRHGGGDARGAEGGRRVPAAGPGVSGGAAGVHGGGLAAGAGGVRVGARGAARRAEEKTFELDQAGGELAKESKQALGRDDLSARPEDPAYVLYTSGSTGKPKGVLVHERAVVNVLTFIAREPGCGPKDRWLAVTTLSFDIALLELLVPLMVGGEVVLASRDDAMEAEALAGLLEQHDITVMQATPVTWRMLVDSGWAGRKGLKVISGGEPLAAELAEALVSRVGEVWNNYGPTETTV